MLKPVEVEERVFRAAGAAALSGFAAVEAQALCFGRFGFCWQGQPLGGRVRMEFCEWSGSFIGEQARSRWTSAAQEMILVC